MDILIIITVILVVLAILVIPFYSKKMKYENLIAKAIEAHDKGEDHYKKALDYLNQALAIKPNDVSALNNKAVLLQKMGSDYYYEALKLYNRVIELDPKQSATYNNKASLLLYVSDDGKDESKINEAIKAFDKAIELDPDFFDAIHTKAQLLSTFARYDEALVVYDDILKRFTFDSGIEKINEEIGDIYLNKGDLAKTFEYYDKAFKDMAEAENYLNLKKGAALMHTGMDRYAEAKQYFEKVLAKMPDNISTLHNMAMMYMDEGDIENSRVYIERAYEIEPDNVDVLNDMGLIYMNMEETEENIDKALEFFNKAYTIEPLEYIKENIQDMLDAKNNLR